MLLCQQYYGRVGDNQFCKFVLTKIIAIVTIAMAPDKSSSSTEHSQDEQADLVRDKAWMYGWRGVRLACLQGCLLPRYILLFCCFLVGTQGFIVTGLSGVVLTSIEKRYYLRSTQIGGIIACYDIGNTICTIIVSYFGHSHKSKWIGCGSLILGCGCLVYALPQLLVGSYSPAVGQDTDLCSGLLFPSNTACRSSEWYHLLVFVLGQLMIGAGASPVYNLGSAYLDENVSRKNSGIFLGIFYAVATVGPGAGYLLGGYFLSTYIDITLPEGVELKPDDNSWIGAWWLGYVFGGCLALIASIPLLGFPREIPSREKICQEKKHASDTVPDDKKPHTANQFLPALKSLFTNKVFLFTTLGGTAEGFAISGSSTFLPKFLQSQFQLTSSNASFYSGVIVIPGGITGMLLGGILIRRFGWTCAQCIKACTVIAFIALFPILIFTVHCPNEEFAGVTTPYYNRTIHSSIDACSTNYNCSCKQDKYIPVCSKPDHLTYFSPCHAGCTNKTTVDSAQAYINCSCLPPGVEMVYEGGCIQSCNKLAYFLPVLFLLIALTFFNNIPAITVTLRCVPESQGSFALGVQQIITRILAFIPAPIVFGALLDSVCVLAETDPCNEGTQRNCLEYKNKDISNVFLGLLLGCKFASLVFFALAWFVYKPPRSSPSSQLSQIDLVGNETNTVHVTEEGTINDRSTSTTL